MKVKEFRKINTHEEDIFIDEYENDSFVRLSLVTYYDDYEIKGIYIDKGELFLEV